ncbi:hypothetical protein ACFJIX_05840 [Roseateles sp. UC29_93]|uniref:hypothetical protein n=1 Tax=Roseateles sp. UC29_93 TaxID=3350177 RepID=UPI003672C42E
MKELPEPLFAVYALSLPRGHGFGSRPPAGAWTTDDGASVGVLTRDDSNVFGVLVMRRRVDDVWTITDAADGISDRDQAMRRIGEALVEGKAREPVPSGVPPRAALYDLGSRTASDVFGLLAAPTHHRAAWMLNQLYLALPRPDANWVSDCQTGNFHTRLWEAILLGAFREQGHLVTQPQESPDFRIENRRGDSAWVEAVTANPSVPYNHFNAQEVAPPTEPMEVFAGAAAVRFAKTLGNKLLRRYDQLPHVKGQPFMIALADFHAAGSMKWSREALIGYLYGHGAEVVEVAGLKQPRSLPFTHLLGPSRFPAGLFANEACAELSAVVFSNACSIAKLNRVAITTFGAPAGLRYMRMGRFFDRAPGALEGRPFCMDIMSDEYRALWPGEREPWSAELEVFHNPFARHPAPRRLLPEATHWFMQDGEVVCASHYPHQILWSQSMILDADKPAPTLEDFLRRGAYIVQDDA